MKKTNYSYNGSEVSNKHSPVLGNGVASPPTAKRKPNIGEASVVRPTKANDLMFPARRSKCIKSVFQRYNLVIEFDVKTKKSSLGRPFRWYAQMTNVIYWFQVCSHF